MYKKSRPFKTITICSLIIIGQLIPGQYVYGQQNIYRLNPIADGSAVLVSSILTFSGLRAENSLPDLSTDEVLALNPLNVNRFDRGAINQNINEIDEAIKNSDLSLGITAAMILSLGIDKSGRSNGTEIFIMYLEAVSLNLALHTWVSYGIDRYRPVTYMEDAELSQRTSYKNKSSFYSGHTSTAATCSFFIAKVWSDLHPELGKKKWFIFSAALIPPIVVGNFRIKGGKHFYTDVLTGTLMGGAIGILIPELHKIGKTEKKLSIYPVITPNRTGIGFIMQI